MSVRLQRTLFLKIRYPRLFFNPDNLLQRDLPSVREDKKPLDRIQLFYPSGSPFIGASVLSLIRQKPGKRNTGADGKMLPDLSEPFVQPARFFLIQFYFPLCKPLCFPYFPFKATSGQQRAKTEPPGREETWEDGQRIHGEADE